jgi:hypothetical protein
VGPMSTRLVHLVVDAADPAGLARFWSGALAWPVTFEEPDEVVIEPARVNLSEAGSVGNHCVVAGSSFGWLIQTGPGSAGGRGGLRTNRSGWVA